MAEQDTKPDLKSFPAIISSLRSPLSMFGLVMLICNAVFSLSAAMMDDINAFIYAIHTFLGIVFAFILIAIWSPRSLYHPAELKGLEDQLPEIKNSRQIITIVLLIGAFSYAGYQIFKPNKKASTEANKALAEYVIDFAASHEHASNLLQRPKACSPQLNADFSRHS